MNEKPKETKKALLLRDLYKLIDQKNFSEALVQAARAAQELPNEPEYFQTASIALVARGDLDLALKCFSHAFALRPLYLSAHI